MMATLQIHPPTRFGVFLLLLLSCLPFSFVSSYKLCAPEDGGGICPDHNTCCPTGKPNVSSCISVKEGDQGACCQDDNDNGIMGLTGCGDGYQCKKTAGNHYLRLGASAEQQQPEQYYCKRIDPDYNGTKPKPLILPRYRLCTLPREVLQTVHGLPMIDSNGRSNAAYFSSMGSLDTKDPAKLSRHQKVTTVVIMVHGSGRTAEDYLCGAVSSLPREQQDPQNATMMVLAPWFLDPEDDKDHIYHTVDANGTMVFHHDYPVNLPNNTLRWVEDGPVIYHTWRYGANAINSTISSFAVVDRMVERLVEDPVRFPSLERVVVAGHSAGGQFVQRWALLSNSPIWGDHPSTAAGKEGEETASTITRQQQRAVSIHAIPANPRCFAFLDDKRFVQKENDNNQTVFQRPSASSIAQCPDYNQWIWGLEGGGNITAPYKDRAITMAGGVKCMTHRYVTQRRLTYLAGGKDEEVFDDDCGSVMQGVTRRQRSREFMASLHELYPEEMETGLHKRVVVRGVPHDHCLMFQSPEGQAALFGGDYNSAKLDDE